MLIFTNLTLIPNSKNLKISISSSLSKKLFFFNLENFFNASLGKAYVRTWRQEFFYIFLKKVLVLWMQKVDFHFYRIRLLGYLHQNNLFFFLIFVYPSKTLFLSKWDCFIIFIKSAGLKIGSSPCTFM